MGLKNIHYLNNILCLISRISISQGNIINFDLEICSLLPLMTDKINKLYIFYENYGAAFAASSRAKGRKARGLQPENQE